MDAYLRLLEAPVPFHWKWEASPQIKPIPEPSKEEKSLLKEVVNEKKLNKMIQEKLPEKGQLKVVEKWLLMK